VNEKSCILIFSNFVLILFFLKKQAVLSNLFCKRKKEKKNKLKQRSLIKQDPNTQNVQWTKTQSAKSDLF